MALRSRTKSPSPALWHIVLPTLLVLVVFMFGVLPTGAAQQQPAPDAGTEDQQQQMPPADGGPKGELGPFALPKTPVEPAPPPVPPKPEEPKAKEMPSYSVNVPEVTVDAMVLSKDGHFIPGLKQNNFRVLEDGVAQQITSFSQTQTPITAVLLIEFSNNNYTNAFAVDALRAAYSFADGLKDKDWVAIIEYDMKPNILLDFTQDKSAIYNALNKLRVPGFNERNLFDALYDTLDRVDHIKGRKEIIVISSGLDSFSKVNYEMLKRKIKETPDVTIFTLSTGRAFNEWLEAHYPMSPQVQMRSLDFLQADNQMNTFAKMTGGRWYNPRFQAEFPEIFRDISNSVRNQYTIIYRPQNTKLDGTYRKLKVELVDPETAKPFVIRDRKNKEIKYTVIAREGYTARRAVE